MLKLSPKSRTSNTYLRSHNQLTGLDWFRQSIDLLWFQMVLHTMQAHSYQVSTITKLVNNIELLSSVAPARVDLRSITPAHDHINHGDKSTRRGRQSRSMHRAIHVGIGELHTLALALQIGSKHVGHALANSRLGSTLANSLCSLALLAHALATSHLQRIAFHAFALALALAFDGLACSLAFATTVTRT